MNNTELIQGYTIMQKNKIKTTNINLTDDEYRLILSLLNNKIFDIGIEAEFYEKNDKTLKDFIEPYRIKKQYDISKRLFYKMLDSFDK